MVYALAYTKTLKPAIFWTATLNHCNSDYRRWVHFREAKNSGVLLCRAQGPYKIEFRGIWNDIPTLLPVKGGNQTVLLPDSSPLQQIADLRTWGFWLSPKFLHGCYMRIIDSESMPQKKQNKKTKKILQFCGLIATGRVVYRETDGEESLSGGGKKHGPITFICIGVDNGVYLDLVVQGGRGSLLAYSAIEGCAFIEDDFSLSKLDMINIEKVRGVSLRELEDRARMSGFKS